ncbi:hypothetical protein Hdeb2414_s0006g00210641 [Helianthus debilis subsp. tardiflorus]
MDRPEVSMRLVVTIISLCLRVNGASSVSGCGDRFPRSGTPPPSKRGPDSGCIGCGFTDGGEGKGVGPAHFQPIKVFFVFFFNKKIRGVKRGVAPSNGGVRGV